MTESGELLPILVKANELRSQKDFRRALALYLDAVEKFGETADLLATIARCYYHMGSDPGESATNYDQAVAWMKKVIKLAPNDPHLLASLGEIHRVGTMNYEEAVRAFRGAVELDPANPSIFVNAAFLYGHPESSVTLEEAIRWLERAVELEPYEPNWHFQLGELYWEAGRRSDAEREWMKALMCPKPLHPRTTPRLKSILNIK